MKTSDTNITIVTPHDHSLWEQYCIVANLCRDILNDQKKRPHLRALARSIQGRILLPYEKACAYTFENPSLLLTNVHREALQLWTEVGQILWDLLLSVTKHRSSSSTEKIQEAETDSPAWVVLTSLSTSLQHIHPSSSSGCIMQLIWSDVSAVYSSYIHLWLTSGSLQDRADEFFIRRESINIADKPLLSAEDEIFYTDGRRLPSFVSFDVAQQILLAGFVIRKLRRMKCPETKGLIYERDLLKVANPTALAGGQMINLKMEALLPLTDGQMINLKMDALGLQCHRFTSHVLSQVLPIVEVQRTVRALRDYLLLGRAIFWRTLLEKIEDGPWLLCNQIEKQTEDSFNRILEGAVESCFVDIDHNGDREVLNFHLGVQSDGNVTATFSLPFPVNCILSPASPRYSNLFSIVFQVRRCLRDLERLFICFSHAYRSRRRQSGGSAALRRLCLTRMRMVGFLKAYDDYTQNDVFETGYSQLMERVVAADEGELQATWSRFDHIFDAHKRALDKWFAHSLASSEPVQRRLISICKCSSEFCRLVDEYLKDGGNFSSQQLDRIEAEFGQNVSLFLRILFSMQGRLGGPQINALLIRLDFNRFYFRDAGSEPVSNAKV